ncbi:MAG: CoB--CoM heterodisulfide reductase iron-sulfur subunit A family protein [Thermoplasmata archaeon]|nr:MAG: CoB--CoM heterodisulfide reductase iron-sulfur subunit A family protein [Thermoplasmata archaeon]
MEKSALVIGGGITGIQTALDLANAQVRVYLLESTPSIGGRMAQLDKTFPTNDCSMCILSPKLVEANRHANITILTNSELEEVSGSSGNFKVKVRRKARFVDEDKCIGCGICAEKCPVKVPNEFDQSLGNRKAIYIPFPQAVPLKYTIDKDNCIYFKNGKCKACLKFCPNEAPVFDQGDEVEELDIGTIVVATGIDVYEPNDRPEFGYGIYPDVITGIEFERMLSPSGPTGGMVLRRSDPAPAKSIVFMQCVGSRNNNSGVPYCSRVCCMYSMKEAIIAKEHSPDLENLTILYTDIRAYGKNFDDYFHRAKTEHGIEFLRGYSAEVGFNPKSNRILINSENTLTGEIIPVEADLLVLATAILPSKSNKDLAEKLDIDLDEYGFFKVLDPTSSMVHSTREGIFLAGCAVGPKDIPDSVSTSSAAASAALDIMTGHKVKIPSDAENLPVGHADEPPRIGVFVCHCGTNIGSVVDVEQVANYAKTLPYVVFSDNNLFTCSDATQQQIRDVIHEHNLNRVVVASCTPRTHEPLFQNTIREAGLNPYLFEMANIREHCSWVHREEQQEATEKAKDLLRMAVAKAANLTELSRPTFHILHSAAVIGGGISGIQAATDLAKKGYKTYLIEKEQELGGRLRDISTFARTGIKSKELLESKISELLKIKSNLTIFKGAELKSVSGSIGNFELELNANGKSQNIQVGAVIVAIGSEVYRPEGEFGYGKHGHVITNLELEENLKSSNPLKFKFGEHKQAVYILCVGSRTAPEDGSNAAPESLRESNSKVTNPGCSRICCDIGIKQAMELQKAGIETTILYRDIRTFDSGSEELYYDAASKGVRFIRFDKSQQPELGKDGKSVVVNDLLTQELLELQSDLIILGCGTIPRVNEVSHLQNLFKIPRGSDGFFLEAHPKLAPLETTKGGIFLCGTAQYPKGVHESITQGSGAALKASILLTQDALAAEPNTAIVDSAICWGCGTCTDICIYGAPSLVERESGEGFVSYINPTLCKGCGACAARCPSGAINANLFTDQQLIAMISALEDEQP